MSFDEVASHIYNQPARTAATDYVVQQFREVFRTQERQLAAAAGTIEAIRQLAEGALPEEERILQIRECVALYQSGEIEELVS